MNETTTVAVLGTGIMGAPMARNCAAAGMAVRAWDRTPEKVQALAGDGVTPVGTPAAAAREADPVVTMLSDGGAVEAGVDRGGGGVSPVGPGAPLSQMRAGGFAAAGEGCGPGRGRGAGH